MDHGNENPTQHLPWWLRKTTKKSPVRLVCTGIWTRDLPNASLVRYHGATSLRRVLLSGNSPKERIELRNKTYHIWYSVSQPSWYLEPPVTNVDSLYIHKMQDVFLYGGWLESNAQYIFFLWWYCGWDVGISPGYSLKFTPQTQCFIWSSSERSMNYGTKMLLSSACEEERSVVRFSWAKGHKPSEIHRDMCGVYGEDRMDRSNFSRWCAFFKELPLWRMCTTWGRCYGQYNLPHTSHTCSFEFHSGYAL